MVLQVCGVDDVKKVRDVADFNVMNCCCCCVIDNSKDSVRNIGKFDG